MNFAESLADENESLFEIEAFSRNLPEDSDAVMSQLSLAEPQAAIAILREEHPDLDLENDLLELAEQDPGRLLHIVFDALAEA